MLSSMGHRSSADSWFLLPFCYSEAVVSAAIASCLVLGRLHAVLEVLSLK